MAFRICYKKRGGDHGVCDSIAASGNDRKRSSLFTQAAHVRRDIAGRRRNYGEEAEKFLIQREIYDVVLAEGHDLLSVITKQVVGIAGTIRKGRSKSSHLPIAEDPTVLEKNRYTGELLSEIRECQVYEMERQREISDGFSLL